MSVIWERLKTGSKAGFDKTWQAFDKVGAPVNSLSNKLGSEAFWPTTLDKESDKAARILKSFCKDGFYAEEEYQPQGGPKQTQKVVKKIPAEVIRNAKGLAIFTTMRMGMWMSGAGGSGILIARKADGSWSPPSGILLHTAGLGFMVGIDIYDCVVVINSEKALEAFYKIRCTLGSEISVSAGPVGAGGVLDTELHKRQAPIFTYMKSRGFYAGVQIDGTVLIERGDENERFYGQRIAVKDILAGEVRHPPFEIKRLLETIKAAQGDDYDQSVLPSEPPPGDFDVDDGSVFGVPNKEDPDPYGVLALEKAGMRVVEAGTHERASWEQFSFNPSPTSPVANIYRHSGEYKRLSKRSSYRGSLASPTTPTRPSSLRQSIELPKKSSMVDSSTQTDVEAVSPALSGMKARSSASSLANSADQMQEVPEHSVLEVKAGYSTPPTTPPLDTKESQSDEKVEDDTIEIVQPAMVKPATQVVSRARLVTVAKRAPPKLPPRNPGRSRANDSPVSKASDKSSLHEFEPIKLETHDAAASPERTSIHSQAGADDVSLPGEGTDIDQEESTDRAHIPSNISSKLREIDLGSELDSRRLSTLSNASNSSTTWDKVRAMRSIEDD